VAADRVDVDALIRPARLDRLAARADQRVVLVTAVPIEGHDAAGSRELGELVVRLRHRIGEFLHACLLEMKVDRLGRQARAAARLLVELMQQASRPDHGPLGADDLEGVAAVADLDVEALLDLAEVLVEGAAEIGQAVGVVGLEGEGFGVRRVVQAGGTLLVGWAARSPSSTGDRFGIMGRRLGGAAAIGHESAFRVADVR